MGAETGFDGWETIDPWWDRFVESRPVALTTERLRHLDGRWLAARWTEIDPWWGSFIDTRSRVEKGETTGVLDDEWSAEEWTKIELWWDSFREVRRAHSEKLRNLLEASDDFWRDSGSRFDVDPLRVDWTSHANTRGPLRRNQEENWSQWLAHLLRSPPSGFIEGVFGVPIEGPPAEVEREVHLPDPAGKDRYADILISTENLGISVEVKKNDEGYAKTPHTAGLVESQRGWMKWHHVLLLPQYKERPLRLAFREGIEATEDDRLEINSEQSGAISVVYWRDISKGIREALLGAEALDPHWEASAYLFCTLIEQGLLGFTPYPTVQKVAAPGGVVHAGQSMSTASGGLTNQIRYLQEIQENDNE